MSLIGFHRVLIGSAILFCLLFAGLNGADFLRGGGTATLLLTLAFAAGGVALAVYLRHLDRVLGREEEGGRG